MYNPANYRHNFVLICYIQWIMEPLNCGHHVTTLKYPMSVHNREVFFIFGHSNKMSSFWLSGFFKRDAGTRVIIITVIIRAPL